MQDSFGPMIAIRTQADMDAFLAQLTPEQVQECFEQLSRVCRDQKFREQQRRWVERALRLPASDADMQKIALFGLRGINAYRKARAA